jgi:hypothetical protein
MKSRVTRGYRSKIVFSGFGGRKGPSSMGKISNAEVLRLRATSAVSRDKSVRRSAQDDGFVGGLEIPPVGYAENTKRSKKSQALRMTILREFGRKTSPRYAR